MNWKLAWFSLATIGLTVALWIAWGWSQNGRWDFVSMNDTRVVFVMDTRTGELYLHHDKINPATLNRLRKQSPPPR